MRPEMVERAGAYAAEVITGWRNALAAKGLDAAVPAVPRYERMTRKAFIDGFTAGQEYAVRLFLGIMPVQPLNPRVLFELAGSYAADVVGDLTVAITPEARVPDDLRVREDLTTVLSGAFAVGFGLGLAET